MVRIRDALSEVVAKPARDEMAKAPSTIDDVTPATVPNTRFLCSLVAGDPSFFFSFFVR